MIAIGFRNIGNLVILAKNPDIKNTGAMLRGAINTAVSTDLT